MKKRLTYPAMRILLCATCALLTYALGPLRATQGQDPSEPSPAPNRALSRMMLPGTRDLQLIIQLTEPSVVEYMAASEGRSAAQRKVALNGPSRLDLQSSQPRAYQAQLAGTQRALMQRLSSISNVEIQASVSTVMNAVIARLPADQYARVRSLPGVKKIHFSRPQKMLLDTSALLENAQGLWDKAGGKAQAGRGIKIGIIDSGIDITNPMLTDNSLTPPSGYPKGETAFTNNKVIVARNYMSLLANSQRVQTAIDEVGHGSFIAGVAAGKQTTAPLATISGMAPGSFLGSYKVFGTPGINDSTTTSAVVAAIDAAVADGMDIINLSLGSLNYLLPADDPETTSIENAISAGVVVTISAGNDGPTGYTISNPGATPDAITVGSATNSRAFMNQLRATAPAPVPFALSGVGYLPSYDGPTITTKISSTSVVDVQTLDGNGYGCSAFPSGSLSSKIAFIQRGGVDTSCTFEAKVSNSNSAGAIAVIVYNNIPSGGAFNMSGLASTRIPAVMISNTDGLALKGFIAANPGSAQAEMDDYQTISATQTAPRVLSSFSSIGPAPNFSIKPDLVAVGENVYSAAQSNNSNGALYSATKFIISQGTSFSAPMVAGAAAGLKQLFPSLGGLAIKSLLANTASRTLTSDGTSPPSILQAGSGLLDMGSASMAGAVFSPTSLNFGAQSYSGTLSLTKPFSIKNISSSADQYTLSIEPLVPGPQIVLSQSITGSVPPAGTATIDVSLQIASPLSGGFQGFVVIKSSATQASYRIPYWAGLYVPDASRILSVSRTSSSGNTFGTLAAALNSARPGNIIEIADSSTYPAGLTISTNSEGLPLNGITIRAAAGQTPIIDGTGLTDQADIQVIGLKNVLFQGLTIKGGSTGILLIQTSRSLPLSATIDHCKLSNFATGSSATGIEVDGGTVDVTRSVISNSTGTGIVAYEGTYLTLFGSTVQSNANDGIDALNANIQILSSTVSNNTGPGLNLDSCSGTIDGSTFSANRGNYGDGIEIADGNFTITNNTFDSNDRAGIGFFAATDTGPGPIVNLSGNTVRANTIYGVASAQAQSLRMNANLIKDNGRGIRFTGSTAALLVNNIIVRSTSTSSGNGIEVAGSSIVRMVNNTIYRNTLQGIVLSAGASASLYNTIISSNRGGDVQWLGSGDIQFSLVGDQTLPGNNITGDPSFVNPDSDVYDLSPGSPALDAGSNSATSLPFLDYNRRLRVASAISGAAPAGGGTVDIGAAEANSYYPLVYPLLANGAQPAIGDSFTTGIAALNYGSDGITANFTAYNPAGGLLAAGINPAVQTMNPGSQIPILSFQLFGFDASTPNLGTVLESSAQRLAGFFLLFDPDFKRFADGVNVSDQTGTDLIFMRHQFDPSGKATYVLLNPGVNPASLTATLLSPSGTPMDTAKTAILAAKGQMIFRFDAGTSSSGYVRVQSDRPISGLEIYGNPEELAALGAAYPASEARLFFPHIAVNQGFTTSIGMINPNPTVTNILLTAYDNKGNVLGHPAPVTLGPNAQLLQSVTDLFDLGPGALLTGYVVAESDQPGVQGFTAFRFDDGTNKSTAAVPVDLVPRQRLLFSHIAHQIAAGSGGTYQTGIALLNPFGTTISYTMRVFDGSGKMLAEKNDVLGPRQKVAQVLSHSVPGAGFFTQPLSLGSGHIEVLTDYALLGFELFYNEALSQLASVPAQIGN